MQTLVRGKHAHHSEHRGDVAVLLNNRTLLNFILNLAASRNKKTIASVRVHIQATPLFVALLVNFDHPTIGSESVKCVPIDIHQETRGTNVLDPTRVHRSPCRATHANGSRRWLNDPRGICRIKAR